jgi:hypothetical protein
LPLAFVSRLAARATWAAAFTFRFEFMRSLEARANAAEFKDRLCEFYINRLHRAAPDRGHREDPPTLRAVGGSVGARSATDAREDKGVAH